MSREIKFRCWSNDYKKMIYEYNPCNNEGRLSFSIDNHYNDNCNGQSDYNLIPMQYTGLLDKTGKEIYEGDIINILVSGEYITDYGMIKSKVCWYKEHSSFGFTTPNGWLTFSHKHYIEIEIIGNIFENPELIK